MLWSALIFGVIGSTHCLGMCGPIALGLPLSATSKLGRFSGALLYNLGRASTYALMGLVLGLTGEAFRITGAQQMLSVIAGLFLILSFGLGSFVKPGKGLSGTILGFIQRPLGSLLHNPSTAAKFATGMLNGLLPCGMVYVALAGSLIMMNPLYSSLYMFIFGLGTLPAMMIISLFGSSLSLGFRNNVQRAIPVFAVVIGLALVLRGLSLNIPYLSPDLDTI